VAWHPHDAHVVVSVHSGGFMRVWDVRTTYGPVATLHDGSVADLLGVDANKYRGGVFVAVSADGSVRAWDVRSPAQPLWDVRGHQLSARRVVCSPHSASVHFTAGYDMTVRTWMEGACKNDLHRAVGRKRLTLLVWRASPDVIVETRARHTEFVCGLDASLFRPHMLASCGWDERVDIWSAMPSPSDIR
jgi:peroxin-7